MNPILRFMAGIAGVLVIMVGWDVHPEVVGFIRFVVCGVAGQALWRIGEHRSEP